VACNARFAGVERACIPARCVLGVHATRIRAAVWIRLRAHGAFARVALACLLSVLGLPRLSRTAEARQDPAAALDAAISAAEVSLRAGERELAESQFRSALLEGFLLRGAIAASEGKLSAARDDFRQASVSAVETRRALESLALAELQLGETTDALEVLTKVVARHPKDLEARRLLVQARVAAGQPEQAVQELEEAHAAMPQDLEVSYLLATGYLRIKKLDAAAALFAEVEKRRPIPETHVLIGRAYRDAGEYARARAELEAAIRQNPRVRRAHYYLGMVAVLAEGAAKLDEAIEQFRQELKIAPDDPLASLRLGMALVEAQRPGEALPLLERSALTPPPSVLAFQYLGRCRLALDRPAEAATALRRALELAKTQPASDSQLGSIHYQLGLALRRSGAAGEAATHFAAAQRYSAERAEDSRERLARYLAGGSDQEPKGLLQPATEDPALRALTAEERKTLDAQVTTTLARCYLNLGVMQAQAGRFARAAGLLEGAARLAPTFPRVQYSLGVARFNAKQYAEATAPLAAALAERPDDASLRRMLAMAWLDSQRYDKAVELLESDPERDSDPSLQYAYGLALVRSGDAARAQAVFARLLREHGDSPELSVLLGQAYAAQGDYPSAIEALTRALSAKPDVADADATLGVIYLKQGKLPDAEKALRAELQAHPDDLASHQSLATVLDLEGRSEEALPLLRAALKAKPDYADARYLLGKILLSQGSAAEAADNLEAAARLSPEDANIHYQLGQAYQKLGRRDDAEREFETFRKLKEKRREGGS
jgi:tetratricopeptide (TPR) repeat protein